MILGKYSLSFKKRQKVVDGEKLGSKIFVPLIDKQLRKKLRLR